MPKTANSKKANAKDSQNREQQEHKREASCKFASRQQMPKIAKTANATKRQQMPQKQS